MTHLTKILGGPSSPHPRCNAPVRLAICRRRRMQRCLEKGADHYGSWPSRRHRLQSHKVIDSLVLGERPVMSPFRSCRFIPVCDAAAGIPCVSDRRDFQCPTSDFCRSILRLITMHSIKATKTPGPLTLPRDKEHLTCAIIIVYYARRQQHTIKYTVIVK